MEWFQSLGLNQKQSQVYLSLLRRGSQTASQLALDLNEQRTNVYLLIEQLLALGIVQKDQSRPVDRFTPVDPNTFLGLMSRKQQILANRAAQLKKDLPELTGLFHLNVADEGLAFFEGLQGYSAALDDMVASQLDVCVFGASDISSRRPDAKRILEAKFQKRAQEKVSTRIIFDESLRDSSGVPTQLSLATKKYSLVRFWGEKPFGNGEVAIYGGTVVLTSYDDQLTSMVIKKPALTALFQTIFDTAWHQAKE